MYSDPHRMSAFTSNLASSVCGKTLPIVTSFTIQSQSEKFLGLGTVWLASPPLQPFNVYVNE